MTGCDYCDEGLPLWHRREGDDMEPTQIIPCQLDVRASDILNLISEMIVMDFDREQIELVRRLAKGRAI